MCALYRGELLELYTHNQNMTVITTYDSHQYTCASVAKQYTLLLAKGW